MVSKDINQKVDDLVEKAECIDYLDEEITLLAELLGKCDEKYKPTLAQVIEIYIQDRNSMIAEIKETKD